jgi:hypothetical protein
MRGGKRVARPEDGLMGTPPTVQEGAIRIISRAQVHDPYLGLGDIMNIMYNDDIINIRRIHPWQVSKGKQVGIRARLREPGTFFGCVQR